MERNRHPPAQRATVGFMLGKTHMGFGALFAAGGAPVVAAACGVRLTPVSLAVGTAVATIAALLPDIDHPDALLTRGWIPFGRKLGPIWKLFGLILSIPPRVIGMLARSAMGHRGGTHSLAFAALWTIGAVPLYGVFFGLLAYVASLASAFVPALSFHPTAVWAWERANLPGAMPMVMLFVALGYISHLASDSLNTVPVPWLWPVSKRRFFFLPKGLRIRVESPTEWMIRMLVMLAVAAVIVLNIVAPVLYAVGSGHSLHAALNASLAIG